jgi:hypothetical protein
MKHKKTIPTNFPTLKCVECGTSCEPYRKYVCDNAGTVAHTHSDIWPEYYRDIGNARVEFCSAQCGLKYCTANQLV